MYELLIGGVSLAIAVGQVYAAPKTQRGKTIFISTVIGCLLIVGLAGVRYYESVQEEARVERVASQILNSMDRPHTFEDLYLGTDGKDRPLVDKAFDKLDNESKTRVKWVDVVDDEGQKHRVRLFSKR